MNEIVLKYKLLNRTGKKEVNDFVDFLLSRQRESKADTLSEYKKKILRVSTWSDSDLDIYKKNNSFFKQWGAKQW